MAYPPKETPNLFVDSGSSVPNLFDTSDSISKLPGELSDEDREKLHRKMGLGEDSRMFSVDTEPLHQWIANKSAKLPKALQWPVAAYGSANLAGVDALLEMVSSAESPAMLGAGIITGAAKKAAEKAAIDSATKSGTESILSKYKAPERLGLPAAPEEVLKPKPRFINGPAGTTEAGKTYPLDTGPANPRMAMSGRELGEPQGTVLPQELGSITQLPAEDAARLGTKLGNIPKILPDSSPDEILGKLGNFKEGSPLELPGDEPPSPSGYDKTRSPDDFSISELPNDNARSFGTTSKEYKSGLSRSQTKPLDLTRVGGSEDGTGLSKENPPKTTSKQTMKDYDSGVKAGVPPPGGVDSEIDSIKNKPEKDIDSLFDKYIRNEFGSVNKTLSSRESTKPIVDGISAALDTKESWKATTERELDDILASGLKRSVVGDTKLPFNAQKAFNYNKQELIEVGKLLDTYENPGIEAPKLNEDDFRLAKTAQALRDKLVEIHASIPGVKDLDTGGSSVGFIKNYLTHIANEAGPDLSDGIKQIVDYHLKQPLNKLLHGTDLGEAGNNIKDFFETALGNPKSPYVLERTGGLENYELDVSKVLPAYIESIAKLKFDKPAVDAAKAILSKLPDTNIYGNPSKLKEAAQWYIKNYSRYDSQPGLNEAWGDLTSKLMRTTQRTMIGLNPGIQLLHLSRVPANLFPALPAKYLEYGIEMLKGKNGMSAYKEAVNLGLLQNEIRPWTFKTPMQKIDSIISAFGTADFLDKSIGYNGFKKMYLDQGMDEAEASLKAIDATKKASLTVDTARPTIGFTKDAKFAGGMLGRLTTQFKNVPTRIIEQYAGIIANGKKDPASLARLVAGVGLTVGLWEEGLRTFHVSPRQFALETGGAFGTVVKRVAGYLAKGDLYNAVKETSLWATPAGYSIRRQLDTGPSMFEPESKDKITSIPRMDRVNQ